MTEVPVINGVPVYLYTSDVEFPKQGNYYIVAGNGNFLHKDSGFFQATVPVGCISVLDDFYDEVVESRLPKVPGDIVVRVQRFFSTVVQQYHTEAIVVLYFHPETHQFRVHVPPQTTSDVYLRYRRMRLHHLGGYIPVGTIHSHCDFGAFHSDTDQDDESTFDGLHVTFGNNDRNHITISASVVAHGIRHKIDPLDCLGGIEYVAEEHSYHVVHYANLCAAELDAEIEKWMSLVNPNTIDVKPGDRVNWSRSLPDADLWKQTYGCGDFEVVGIELDHDLGDVFSLKAQVQGTFTLPSCFFTKEITCL